MKLSTFIRSRVMTLMSSQERRARRHEKFAKERVKNGTKPEIHYFHQADDPYSHLSVQVLEALVDRYEIKFSHHLVAAPKADYQGDTDRFPAWAVRDANDVAPYYGLEPPLTPELNKEAIAVANQAFTAAIKEGRFETDGPKISTALWHDEVMPDALAPAGEAARALAEGTELRDKWGHYFGAMFWFEGEWYWGVDRLYHLEQRLIGLGASRQPDAPLVVPRPTAPQVSNASDVTLEVFPSLRSPYTAISFKRTTDMAARTGVNLVLKPVMPMMMRGVPAPRNKAMYIVFDTAREAAEAGVPFGKFCDPFGEPVKTAFSLYPYAAEAGKGAEYIQSYLDAAFAEGINITSKKGLRIVIERAGLDWAQAEKWLNKPGWEDLLESNVNEMLDDAGLWGVPSFRVSGGSKAEPFSTWGQDRLWRVEAEIAERTQ